MSEIYDSIKTGLIISVLIIGITVGVVFFVALWLVVFVLSYPYYLVAAMLQFQKAHRRGLKRP